jgi:hypothetical protein
MRDINGYAGIYAVTEEGRVWSYPKGKGKNVNGKWLTPIIGKSGSARRISERHQASVMLYKHGKRKCKLIHRLVAEAYVPNLENKPDVNHIDGNTLNNSAYNLEWVTKSENMQHAQNKGLLKQNTDAQRVSRIKNGKQTYEQNFRGGA